MKINYFLLHIYTYGKIQTGITGNNRLSWSWGKEKRSETKLRLGVVKGRGEKCARVVAPLSNLY